MKTKTFTKLIMAGLVLIGSSIPPTFAASYLIGLSPNYEAADREKILQQVLLFMLQGAAPGDDIVVCDALHMHVVTRALISQGSLFQNNAQARARHLVSSIAAVKDFILAEHVRLPEAKEAIRLPEFLALAGEQLRKPGQPLRVILVGSPLYVGDDNAFDERDAYPSDAALSADAQKSPFSVLSRKNTLVGVTVHFAYLRDCFVNDFHRERITRFLALYLKEQSGCLATFAPDPSLAFQRACDNIQQAVVQAEIDPNDTKFEMRHVQARSIPVWFGPVTTVQNTVVSNMVPQNVSEILTIPTSVSNAAPPIVSQAPPNPTNNPPQSVINQATNPPSVVFPVSAKSNILGIGLMWSVPADIDLYVKPNDSAQELFYGNTRTREGTYFHDYRSANEGIDYEYVELKAPVDIRNVSAWANYYGGRAWPIRGKVIVYHEGKTYYGEFTIAARLGNRGGEFKSRSSSACWTKIDLLKFVGLQ